MRKCATCTKQFLPKLLGPIKYCSATCYYNRPAKHKKNYQCAMCKAAFICFDRHTLPYKPKFCSRTCFIKWKRTNPNLSRADLKSTLSPTNLDIAWAAGIYEGEGSISGIRKSETINIGQKDPWILYKLRNFFGGRVGMKKGGMLNGKFYNGLYNWNVNGARARGFSMTIFSFLSPRRKEKIQQILKEGCW